MTWPSSTRWWPNPTFTVRRRSCKAPGLCCPGSPAWERGVSYGPRQPEREPAGLLSSCPTPAASPLTARPTGSAGFLPAAYQGTMVRAGAKNPIFDLFPAGAELHHQAERPPTALAILNKLNRDHQATREGDFPPRRPHRLLRAGGAVATERPGGTRHLQGVGSDAEALWPRREDHRGTSARNLPDRPAAAGAGALRFVQVWSGADKRLPAAELGLPRGTSPRDPRRHGHEHGPPPPPPSSRT